MKNPSHEETDKLKVRILRTAVNTILEDSELTSALIKVNVLTWKANSLYVNAAWNYSISNINNVPKPMRFYHSST